MEYGVELYLLKIFLIPEFWKKYHTGLRRDFISDNSRLLGQLFGAVDSYYADSGFLRRTDQSLVPEGAKETQKPLTPADLQVWFLSLYPALPKTERELLGKLCENLDKIEIRRDIAEEYLRTHLQQVRATELAVCALKVSQGKETYENLRALAKEIQISEDQPSNDEFVTDDLEEILRSQVLNSGLKWRLPTLNRMLGSLRQGDFGFIFKRPETGGTTLLASEATFMGTQSDRPVLWVNNEEGGRKVKLRCYEAHFGMPLQELMKKDKWEHYRTEYMKALGGKIKIFDNAFSHRKEVERICSSLNPSLIIFDQIDKIKGFDSDRDDLELKQIYQWARELAKGYGPVIGVCQASVSAENKKYLTMDDVDRSKTAKQGEADWILGIGKTHNEGMENVRHLHLCKNKLIGDVETSPGDRHGKADVLILPHIARYADYN